MSIHIYDGHMKPLSKEAKCDFIDKEFGKDKEEKEQVNGQETNTGKDQKLEVKNTPAAEDDSAELKIYQG